MKKLVDGKVVEMTPEEIKELQAMTENAPLTPPSPEERIAELAVRLSRYEDNERATNILLGVSE